jgi:hypothetical protein
MRPLSEDEIEISQNPYLNDLRWVDDPAHVDDLLREGKGDKGLDDMFEDSIYGDIHMKTPEEAAERSGDDKILSSWKQPRRARVKISAKTVNKAVVSGLNKKLVVEHANWLAGKDREMGIAVRPRSYYENVGQLWSRDKLNKASLPTTTSGNWNAHPAKVASKAQLVLDNTKNARLRFSPELGDEVDMGGWSPFKAIKKAVSSATSAVKSTASLAYKGAKFGITKPFVYTYKGVKYVGNKALQLALTPIKIVVRRFRNKMVNRKASELAKQRGLSTPGSKEKSDALAWTKSTTSRSGNKLARLSVSLMGSSEYGMKNVDISLGDEMGLSNTTLYPLIALGGAGLAVIFASIYKSAFKQSSGSAATDATSTDAATSEASDTDTSTSDASSQEASTQDADSSQDANSSDTDADASTEQNDSSGRTYTLEQLNAMPRRRSAQVQQLIRSGRARLA